MTRFVLPAFIVVLALADAFIHLSLDIFFFSGQFLTGFLSVLFLLNFVGYVVVTTGFVISLRWFSKLSRIASFALLAYATATILAWIGGGQDDLLGLGYVSKATEVALILTLILQLRTRSLVPTRRLHYLTPSREAADEA